MMKNNPVPLHKQSKKAQREFHSSKRGNWNGLNPVTRVKKSGKEYNRRNFKEVQ